MEFPSINIQGNIISSEILDKIRNEDIKYQTPADFGLERRTSVRDEIGLAWAAARGHYIAFKLRVDRLKDGESGASETRNSWMLPLLRELGYDVEKAPAYIHPDSQKTYAISHGAQNLAGFPIHIMGYNDKLDVRREAGGPRLSPHALTQEYLNNTDHVYALVSNGRYLRLLRDATRLVRLSYLEFDLVKMMEEDLYTDFAILFRLLHASRMPKNPDQAEDSFIEFYHQESLASGSRIREKLSQAVEQSIKDLANGFLIHRENEELRKWVQSGSITAADFYLYQLRLIYRLLFLIVTEERNLVFPESKNQITQKQRKIYYSFYSIERLRKLAAKRFFVDGRKYDLWEGLKSTFMLFENAHYGERLGIMPLGSGLFSPGAIGDLSICKIDNESLLKVIRQLTFFENDQKQLVRVNYSDLDVEEFGSVYEGLLELEGEFSDLNGNPFFKFVPGKGRSSSGSHYTPEELVKPLIKHSLEYILEDKLKESNQETALLSIKVCDVACGSGHILLSAARRIATELARVRTHEDQPAPPAMRVAIRDVIRQCIYGVDKNPLAVELCKVALWLEAHNPGEPLNFLDHHIKCGDSLVGLANKEELSNGIADEAFKALPGDEKEVAEAFAKKNKTERKDRLNRQTVINFDQNVSQKLEDILTSFEQFDALTEHTPQEIDAKAKAYNRLIHSGNLQRLKTLADIQVGQFFIPKTTIKKESLATDGGYFLYLTGEKPIPQFVLGECIQISAEKRFFHWFLEFPEVFQKGGFDCVLGNPPFLGGQKISGTFGDNYLEYIKFQFAPIGAVDFVTYFFRRIFEIIKLNGFQSLISTNTIAQGRAREDGLEVIIRQGGTINHALRNMKWPGKAAVVVSLVTLTKQIWKGKFLLAGKEVTTITTYLDNAETVGSPFALKQNENKSFQGSILLGKGFTLEPLEAKSLIIKNGKNNDVLFPYLNGDELNNNPDQKPSRWVINFFDWPEDRAKGYPECYEIVERLVKPERILMEGDRGAEYWWQFLRARRELYCRIESMARVLVIARISKTVAFHFIESKSVFADALVVFPFSTWYPFALLQSSLHNNWAWTYCTTMKSDLNYTPGKTFDTFPFPQKKIPAQVNIVESIGAEYHDHRHKLMLQIQLGLTRTYNLFHTKELRVISLEENLSANKSLQKSVGKESEHLRRHLSITAGTIPFNDAIIGVFKLRELHMQLDKAVLEAYGWSDIQLRHDFYEVDYLPENDRIRFTVHPDARKEILKRLLELNHQIFEEEARQGLHKEEDVKKFYEQKGKPVPAGIQFSDKQVRAKKKGKAGGLVVEEPDGHYGDLFDLQT